MDPEVSTDPLKSAVMAYVQRVLDGELRLAPLPWMASRLALYLRNETNPDWRRIAGLVKSDVILSTQTLGAVNVQAEQFGSRICSIDSAVSHLGPSWFRKLAKRHDQSEDSPSPLLPLHRLVWRHSLMRAELATSLADNFGQWPDEAYACALLGELGTLAALRCLEELLSTHTASAFSPNRCLALARSYNADILTVLLDPLHLPSAIRNDTATKNNTDSQGMSELLQVANTIAGTMDSNPCFGLQSMTTIPGMECQKRRETVAGAAMGISASIEYLDCQGADTSLPLSTTIPRRRAICPMDYEVTLEEPSATYSSLHVCGLSMSVQGAIPAEPGSVTRMSVLRNYERYRFAVLVQRCVLGERGYVVDLVHLPVHEEGLVRWQGLVGEANRDASPSKRRHARARRIRRGDVSQAFAAIHQEELQREIAALPGDISQVFDAIQMPLLVPHATPVDEFDDKSDTADTLVEELEPTLDVA